MVIEILLLVLLLIVVVILLRIRVNRIVSVAEKKTTPFFLRDEYPEEVIRHVAQSQEWYYFGRNFSTPKYNDISCGCEMSGNTGHFASAIKVFEYLQLDLEALSQIFVEEPWTYYLTEPKYRTKQRVVRNYSELERCRAWDDEGWENLAKLIGKTITFIHCHGAPEGLIRAVYFPSGESKRINYGT